MKKKILSLLVLSGIAVLGTRAQTEFKSGIFKFTTTGPSTVEVSGADSKDANGNTYTTYTIPATVEEGGVKYSVTAIGEGAFRWSNATSITLPESIETIKMQAFGSSTNLTSINMPEKLVTIGDYAFSSTGLTSLTLPAGVQEIGNNAFFTCKALESITLNDGLKRIGTSAFYKSGIKSIVLPESLEELGAKAFLFCDKLASVNLPSGIKVLGDGTFYGCKVLSSITLPEGITEIGEECFLECAALESISIPSTVEKIARCFIANSGVTSITVDAANNNFKILDGVLYDKDTRLLYAVPMKGVTEVVVNNKCIGINGGAFWGSAVKKVTLPDGMLAIDDYAFCQSDLAEINFPNTITFIGEQGFAATKLTDVTLPANMPYVYDGAFAGCESMTSLTIPSGVKMIYNHAFHDNKNLQSVTILGAAAPQIDDVYEDYDSPFFGISKSTPLYVPKGSTQSYKTEGWDRYFTITESALGVLGYASINPDNGTQLGKNAEIKVEVTFGEDVTIVNDRPEAFLREGSEVAGATINPDEAWHAVYGNDKKTLCVWASDYDGYTMWFSPKQDMEYYMIIPAGVVKNAAGELNEKIVIKWNGPAAPKPLQVVSTNPENGATLTAGWTDMSFDITFDSDITILDYGPDATLRKNDKDNGPKITPDLQWKAVKGDNDQTLRLWASDYDGFIQQFKVEENTKYYMTIPAGIVKSADDARNEEIVIELNGPAPTAINGVAEGDGAKESARYNLNGQKLSAKQRGVNIVRMSDGSTIKVYVK